MRRKLRMQKMMAQSESKEEDGYQEKEDHGHDEPADEDVEDAGDVGEAQLALRCRLLLLLALRSVVPPSEHQTNVSKSI